MKKSPALNSSASLTVNNAEGFTLLEMLIVLGIIAVILSVLSVSFSITQKKSRDARRKGDLKAIQNGLEQYYATCSYLYPIGSGPMPTGSIACGASPAVIPIVPLDPKTGITYSYDSVDGSSFSVCATLETETPSNYCLTSQQ